MWVPGNLEQLEQAVTSGALEEKHDFDAKRELPTSNKELAKDIAAMTTDGGLLVYGIAEDDNGQPRVLQPIELSGAAERIDQVAQHSLSGTPKIEFVHLRTPEDGGRGYLVVVVPPSPEAPHQVTVGNDRRFYGRNDTGNRRLSEEEIARLYERRRMQSVDREEILQECVARSPFGSAGAEHGFLQAFVQPVPPDDDLWARAVDARDAEDALLKELRDAVASAAGAARWGGASIGSAVNWTRRGADAWTLDTAVTYGESNDPTIAARADLSMDGRGYLFYGGAADTRESKLIVYERGIALNLAQFLGLAGALYHAGGLYGPVDVGMAVTGISGAISSFTLGDRFLVGTPYGEEFASRTERSDARELHEQPGEVSQRLLGRFFNATFGRDFNPLYEN
jgi:hypothetical protein